VRANLSDQYWWPAFEINSEENWLRRPDAISGARGCLRELAKFANEEGIFWGGHFGNKDEMHIEVAEPSSACVRTAFQRRNLRMFDPKTLNDIPDGTDINSVGQTQLKNVQRALSWLTYPISAVDGLIGPNTRNAFAEFKLDIGESDVTVLTAQSKSHAITQIEATKSIMARDVSTEDGAKAAIADMCRQLGLDLKAQIAYVLATTQWETAHTFQPVKEAYWKSEAWRQDNFRYYPYYGRGYVQLTWKSNYSKYFHILREPLVNEPDLALDPEISLFVLVHGFKLGVFTGRKLEHYINGAHTDFKNARKCINGLDKWAEIKELAEAYERAL